MTVGRISQAAVEALLRPVSDARLSQQTTELLLRQLPRARLGHQGMEILRSATLAVGTTLTRPMMILFVSA